jgi:hypothetical protein
VHPAWRKGSALLGGLALVSALLAGCAAKPVAGPTVTRNFGPNQLVLRVDVVPGLLSDITRFTRLPTVSVYGDGRVLTPAPQRAVYPAPALQTLLVQQISVADVRRLVDMASKAGVGSGADLGKPNISDAPSTRFTMRTDTGWASTTVLALGMASDSGLTSAQKTGRAALSSLVTALSDLPSALGPVPSAAPFVPAGVVAVAKVWSAPADPAAPAPAAVDWPGPALPGAYVGMGLTCVSASGGASDAVLAAAAHANVSTPWTSGDGRWTVALRLLLPDETGCEDLAH